MSEKAKQVIFTVLALIVVALYIVGIFLMIFGNARNGIDLWVISTVLGALLLFIRSKLAKKKADAEAEEAEERARLEKEGR